MHFSLPSDREEAGLCVGAGWKDTARGQLGVFPRSDGFLARMQPALNPSPMWENKMICQVHGQHRLLKCLPTAMVFS